MARARIVHHYTDGAITELSVSSDDTFPDALDELRVQVIKLWREACCAESETDVQ